MEVRALTRNVRISPEKARHLSRLIQGKSAVEALAIVDLSPRKAAGLLGDEDGKLSSATRHKLLDAFGYGSWETAEELRSLHEQRADGENLRAASGAEIEAEDTDDHDVHIRSHIRWLLGSECEKAEKRVAGLREKMRAHVRSHREMKALSEKAEAGNA